MLENASQSLVKIKSDAIASPLKGIVANTIYQQVVNIADSLEPITRINPKITFVVASAHSEDIINAVNSMAAAVEMSRLFLSVEYAQPLAIIGSALFYGTTDLYAQMAALGLTTLTAAESLAINKMQTNLSNWSTEFSQYTGLNANRYLSGNQRIIAMRRDAEIASEFLDKIANGNLKLPISRNGGCYLTRYALEGTTLLRGLVRVGGTTAVAGEYDYSLGPIGHLMINNLNTMFLTVDITSAGGMFSLDFQAHGNVNFTNASITNVTTGETHPNSATFGADGRFTGTVRSASGDALRFIFNFTTPASLVQVDWIINTFNSVDSGDEKVLSALTGTIPVFYGGMKDAFNNKFRILERAIMSMLEDSAVGARLRSKYVGVLQYLNFTNVSDWDIAQVWKWKDLTFAESTSDILKELSNDLKNRRLELLTIPVDT